MNKIVNIEPLFLRYPFPSDIKYEYSGGVVENMDAALVRVRCESGETGLGEITHGQFCYEPVPGANTMISTEETDLRLMP